MVEVKVNMIKQAIVTVSNEQMEKAFAPERNLTLWSIDRLPDGTVKLTFGRHDDVTKFVGEGARFE